MRKGFALRPFPDRDGVRVVIGTESRLMTAIGCDGFPGVGTPGRADIVRRAAVLLRTFLQKAAQVLDFGSFGKVDGPLPAFVACIQKSLQKFRGCFNVHSS